MTDDRERGRDAIRDQLAADLAATRSERDEALVTNDQLRTVVDELRRTLIHERAERKAEAGRQTSAVRWSL